MEKKKALKRRPLRETIRLAFTRTCKQILTIDLVRYLIALPRFIYFAKILRRVKVYKGDKRFISDNTIYHNFPKWNSLVVIRSNLLIRPLSITDPVYTKIEQLHVLSIGPKAEGEILNLIGYGFSPKKIRGLDLVSYSPYVDVGDMHNLPYHDNSFDVVISGWVLQGYTNNPKRAAQEMLRVVKNKGIIAIGIGWVPKSHKDRLSKLRGYSFERYLDNVQDILDLFGKEAIDHIYLSQDLTKEGEQREFGQDLLLIFSVKKESTSEIKG